MRHYDRVNYRHLNDSGRYRDYEYLADDGWVGPNERASESMMAREQPLPSERETVRELASDQDREQGRGRGRTLLDAIRHPGELLKRIVRGIFLGKAPKIANAEG